jgi:hypothetical protein
VCWRLGLRLARRRTHDRHVPRRVDRQTKHERGGKLPWPDPGPSLANRTSATCWGRARTTAAQHRPCRRREYHERAHDSRRHRRECGQERLGHEHVARARPRIIVVVEQRARQRARRLRVRCSQSSAGGAGTQARRACARRPPAAATRACPPTPAPWRSPNARVRRTWQSPASGYPSGLRPLTMAARSLGQWQRLLSLSDCTPVLVVSLHWR